MLEQEQAIDNLVSVFEREVSRIVAKARRETLAYLQDRLNTTDGVVDRTQANVQTLQRVESAFKRTMNQAGYGLLVDEYVRSFNGQFVYFNEVVESIGKAIRRDLKITFGVRDKALFLQQQHQSKIMLKQAVDAQARAAQQQAMYSVGAVKSSELTKLISVKLDMTTDRASAIADTALSTFYRTISDRGYQQMESQLSDAVELLYKYGGPNDKLTRPKCREWLAGTKETGWTREYIDSLSNGQLPNVFLTCGGFRCRHQWIPQIRLKEESRSQKKRKR